MHQLMDSESCGDRHKQRDNRPPQKNVRATTNKEPGNKLEKARRTCHNQLELDQANREWRIYPVHRPITEQEKDNIIANQTSIRQEPH